jgi:hypothetical protein
VETDCRVLSGGALRESPDEAPPSRSDFEWSKAWALVVFGGQMIELSNVR